jgi:predicted amidohydrolase YtcJ
VSLGVDRLRSRRHRIEHVEMLDSALIKRMVEYGIVASVQPAFDAAWGGLTGMYAQRLGPHRALTLNPFAAMTGVGVPLAFGSDAPVTALDPWGAVRAAAHHRNPHQSISVRAAFAAHTRGGWRALGRDDEGVLAPGAPASFAVWDADEVVVQAPDERVARWSTDPRAAVPGLPDLAPGMPLPICLRTVVRGETIFRIGGVR